MFSWLRSLFSSAGDEDVAATYGFDSYLDARETIKELKSNEDHDELEQALMWCINDTEARDQETGVAPYYYEQLAILNRKQDRYDDEVSVLKRYQNQPHAPGKKPEQLTDRLERARELAS